MICSGNGGVPLATEPGGFRKKFGRSLNCWGVNLPSIGMRTDERAQQPCQKTSDGKHVWKVFGTPATKTAYYRCFACGVMGDAIEGSWIEERGRFQFVEEAPPENFEE